MAAFVVSLSLLAGLVVPSMATAKPEHHRHNPASWTYAQARKEPHRAPRIQPVRRIALSLRGVPYVWAGSDPSSGLDCSGFTRYVMSKFGVSLDHFTGSQINAGVAVANVNDVRAGDLLFPNSGHVMLAIGDGEAEHAPHSGDVVRVVPLTSRTYIAIRRIPGVWKDLSPRKPRYSRRYQNHERVARLE